MSSIKNQENIPDVALCRFDRCKCRRNKFASPEDSLTHCSHLRTCNAWQNVIEPKSTGEGTLCLQVSFDRDVMLVGITFEVGTDEQIEAYSRIFRESDGSEVSRQRIGWSRCVLRRTSLKVEPEPWVEADLVLLEPLFLTRNEIYSVYLKSNFDRHFLPVGTVENRRKKVDTAFATFHVNDIVAVRELHLVPDVRVSWGYRGPTV